MPAVDLTGLSGVVHVRAKDGARPDAELSAIEEDKLKNFTFSATDAYGRDITLSSGMLRVLAKNRFRADELLSSSDFRGLLRAQANEDVAAVVDRKTTGSMVYPAGLFDHRTVSDTLSIFPNLSDIHLVDIQYDSFHRLFDGRYFEDFTVACGLKMEKPLEHRGVLGKGGEIIIPVRKGERPVIVHFHSEDALKIDHKMVGDISVAVVKYPGEGGGLEEQPGFYDNLASVTRTGGYVMVKWAKKPVMMELKPVIETDMTGPGSSMYVSADDWAVYQKKT